MRTSEPFLNDTRREPSPIPASPAERAANGAAQNASTHSLVARTENEQAPSAATHVIAASAIDPSESSQRRGLPETSASPADRAANRPTHSAATHSLAARTENEQAASAPMHLLAASAISPSESSQLRDLPETSASPTDRTANGLARGTAMLSLSSSAISPTELAEFAQCRGLTLRPNDALRLLQAEQTALSDTGRLLLDDGILPPLIEVFADSPYLTDDAAETLAALAELFYHLKNETADRIPDERLLQTMRQHFDEPCRGSVEWLADLLGEGCL